MPTLLFAFDLTRTSELTVPLTALVSLALGLLLGRFLYYRPGAEAETGPAQPAPDGPPVGSEEYWAERRSAPRFSVRQLKVLLLDPKSQAEPFEGWLLNRSLGGLGLSVPRQVEAGNIISVRPADGGEVTPWVRVEVRYCRLERGRWTLGCKFVDPLPSTSLLFA